MASPDKEAISPLRNQPAIEQTNGHQTAHQTATRSASNSNFLQIPESDLRKGKQNEIEVQASQKESQNGLWTEKSPSLSRLALKLSNAQWQPEENPSEVETRLVPHHYFIQRPRALQYTYKSKRIDIGDDGGLTPQTSNSVDIKYTLEGIAKSRERIDLFIDLVWVGIISNLSEVFSQVYFQPGDHAAAAFLEFNLIFLPAWRIWNFLREFLNSYYKDDTIQRVFICWILILSVFFGNNLAYFPDNPQRIKTSLVTLYLFIRGSFLIQEVLYSIWIPWLRKLIFFNFLIALPAVGLWIATIYVQGNKAIGPALAAVILEYITPLITDSPIGDKMTPGEYRKEVDPIHLRTRMGSFFIITVGEGVLMLIRGGPLGMGITNVSSLAIMSLVIYFILTYIYFIRDNSMKYTPAVRHRGWRLVIWIAFHVPIFASFISLSGGILFFINRNSNLPVNTEASQLSDEEFAQLKYRGLWDIAASLSIILFSCTVIALLDKSHDPPKTHLIDNRFIRLSGRFVYIMIICLVLIAPDINVYLYLGICSVGASLLLMFESAASLELPARFFEPKGMSVLMKKVSEPKRSEREAEAEVNNT